MMKLYWPSWSNMLEVVSLFRLSRFRAPDSSLVSNRSNAMSSVSPSSPSTSDLICLDNFTNSVLLEDFPPMTWTLEFPFKVSEIGAIFVCLRRIQLTDAHGSNSSIPAKSNLLPPKFSRLDYCCCVFWARISMTKFDSLTASLTFEQ